MRKRGYFVLIALATVVAAGVVGYFRAPREPRYEGKPLSYWLKGYDRTFTPEDIQFGQSAMSARAEKQADKAIVSAGTNAIPTLLRLIEAKDSTLDLKLRALARRFHYKISGISDAERKYQRAGNGFAALGDQARSAVPALVGIYDRNISGLSREYTLFILTGMEPAAREAGPALVRWVVNRKYSDFGMIRFAWERIHPRPEVAVPALIKLLADTEPSIRIWAAGTLGSYWYAPDSARAIPALDQLRQHDSDSKVRESADYTYQMLVLREAQRPN